jgi:Tol biopolymer transport system component
MGPSVPTPVQLTSGPLNYSQPTPSADGKSLFAYGTRGRGELVRYDARLGEFVPYLGGISAFGVSFSPDAKSVAYISHFENTLWRARADGSDKRQLTLPPLDVAGLAWSPDGTRLAIRASYPGARKKIYLLPVEGGTPTALTPEDREQGTPTWSPDGRIVFGDVPGVFGQPDGSEVLHIFDPATQQLSELPDSQGLWTSRWSPDGRYISALTIHHAEGQKLRLFDVNTQRWRHTDADHVSNPTWSRDSQYIYYDTEGNTRALRRVRVSDGRVEQLATLDNYPVAHYGWSGLSLDGSPIILGRKYDIEVYAFDIERR